MLGNQKCSAELFQCVTMESLVPEGHMLRRLKAVLDFSFVRPWVADRYSDVGRPSVDPEVAVRIWVLQHLYGLSERQVCDEMHMHGGFRWFCGLSFNDDIPDQSTLVKLRNEKWAGSGLWEKVLGETVRACEAAGICRPDRLALDGTQIRANASMASMAEIPANLVLKEVEPGFVKFAPVPEPCAPRMLDGGRERPPRERGDPNFRGEKFTNHTHRSATDPEARLYRKSSGQEAHLRFLGHYLCEPKSGVIYGACATQATGAAEREAGLLLLERLEEAPRELLMDRGYRDGAFFAQLLRRGVMPLVPMEDRPPEPEPVWQRETASFHRAGERKQKLQSVRARNRVREYVQTPCAKRALKLRIRIERLFAEGKTHHGLSRAHRRGTEQLGRQVNMTAAVQNLKRLAAHTGRRRAAGVAALKVQASLSAVRWARNRPGNYRNTTHRAEHRPRHLGGPRSG